MARNAHGCLRFLGQPMGRSLHAKLRRAYQSWQDGHDDAALLAAVGVLADEFGKAPSANEPTGSTRREHLELICFEYVTG